MESGVVFTATVKPVHFRPQHTFFQARCVYRSHCRNPHPTVHSPNREPWPKHHPPQSLLWLNHRSDHSPLWAAWPEVWVELPEAWLRNQPLENTIWPHTRWHNRDACRAEWLAVSLHCWHPVYTSWRANMGASAQVMWVSPCRGCAAALRDGMLKIWWHFSWRQKNAVSFFLFFFLNSWPISSE